MYQKKIWIKSLKIWRLKWKLHGQSIKLGVIIWALSNDKHIEISFHWRDTTRLVEVACRASVTLTSWMKYCFLFHRWFSLCFSWVRLPSRFLFFTFDSNETRVSKPYHYKEEKKGTLSFYWCRTSRDNVCETHSKWLCLLFVRREHIKLFVFFFFLGLFCQVYLLYSVFFF